MKDGLIKNAGLRVTQPRKKILEVMEQSNLRHLSVEDVHAELEKRGESLGLGTIYRVLRQFEAVGIVVQHFFNGGTGIFELHGSDHHDHLICVKCGAVQEFYDDTIEKRQSLIAERLGFEVVEHSHVIYGICGNPDCQSSK